MKLLLVIIASFIFFGWIFSIDDGSSTASTATASTTKEHVKKPVKPKLDGIDTGTWAKTKYKTNIRSGPSLNHRVVEQKPAGSVICLDTDDNEWGHICGSDRPKRYVKKSILNIAKNKDEANQFAKLLLKQGKEEELRELAKEKATKRKWFANQYEKQMLNEGLDVYASVSGKDNTTLKIKFILVSRPLVHQLANSYSFTKNIRDYGFKKVIFTDGYDESWTLNYS